jgi:hypothetical protein
MRRWARPDPALAILASPWLLSAHARLPTRNSKNAELNPTHARHFSRRAAIRNEKSPSPPTFSAEHNRRSRAPLRLRRAKLNGTRHHRCLYSRLHSTHSHDRQRAMRNRRHRHQRLPESRGQVDGIMQQRALRNLLTDPRLRQCNPHHLHLPCDRSFRRHRHSHRHLSDRPHKKRNLDADTDRSELRGLHGTMISDRS